MKRTWNNSPPYFRTNSCSACQSASDGSVSSTDSGVVRLYSAHRVKNGPVSRSSTATSSRSPACSSGQPAADSTTLSITAWKEA